MSIQEHQDKGYDRHVGMFSPDGLLLQVEYAEKAVTLGATSIGIVYDKGIVFLCERKIKSKLLIKENFRKIFEIDSKIFVCGSGVMSDGRRLIEQAQDYAKENRVKFEEQIDIISVVKDIANIQQYYSQSGGLRPFGVSLIIGGIENNEKKLYQTTPSGIFLRYRAISVGRNSNKINEFLEENYKNDLTYEKALKLGIDCFENLTLKSFKKEDLEIKKVEL
jgi:proteasome alpha subunit